MTRNTSLDVTHAFACEIRSTPYSTRCTCGVRSNGPRTDASPTQEGKYTARGPKVWPKDSTCPFLRENTK